MRFRFLAVVVLATLAHGTAKADSPGTLPFAQSSAAESSHVFCDGTGTAPVRKAPCVLRSMYVTPSTTAGYLMTFNATSAPVDGAVTPVECIAVPASTTMSFDFGNNAQAYTTGLVAVFSTTGCFTKTASATAFFKAQAQ